MLEPDAETACREHPLIAYLSADRYVAISELHAFPFPFGFRNTRPNTPCGTDLLLPIISCDL